MTCTRWQGGHGQGHVWPLGRGEPGTLRKPDPVTSEPSKALQGVTTTGVLPAQQAESRQLPAQAGVTAPERTLTTLGLTTGRSLCSQTPGTIRASAIKRQLPALKGKMLPRPPGDQPPCDPQASDRPTAGKAAKGKATRGDRGHREGPAIGRDWPLGRERTAIGRERPSGSIGLARTPPAQWTPRAVGSVPCSPRCSTPGLPFINYKRSSTKPSVWHTKKTAPTVTIWPEVSSR